MAASLVRKFSGLLISQSTKVTCQPQPVLTGMQTQQRYLSYWNKPSIQPSTCLKKSMPTKDTGSLLSVCSPIVNSLRTKVRYSIRIGKPKTVKAVVNRFFRLPWGIYIRPRAGRHKSKWKKPDWINERGKYHVFCNKTQSHTLDKMTTKYWKKRRYYVNDPYEPYLKRTGMDYVPPKFLP